MTEVFVTEYVAFIVFTTIVPLIVWLENWSEYLKNMNKGKTTDEIFTAAMEGK